jgi:hypothetical protein
MNNADDIPQSERRRIMVEERRGKTYMGHALDAELEMGGRFARVNTTTVVGSAPIQYPAQPATSPWHSEPIGPEPPLGYSVDDQEPVGEMFERAPSVISRQDGGVGDGSNSDATSEVRAVMFKRRF